MKQRRMMSFRIREELRQRVHAKAAENGRSIAEQIEHCLERSFEAETAADMLRQVFREQMGEFSHRLEMVEAKLTPPGSSTRFRTTYRMVGWPADGMRLDGEQPT